MAKKIENIHQLTQSLLETYEQIQNDEISLNKAKQLAHTADKVIRAQCANLRYKQWQEKVTPIPFFECGEPIEDKE